MIWPRYRLQFNLSFSPPPKIPTLPPSLLRQTEASTMSSKSRRVPLELRRRTEHSCDRCKTRKQKCIIGPDDEKCRHCLKYGYDCAITKPRKQRFYGSLEAHGTKMAVLESIVKGLVPEIDTSNLDDIKEMGRSLGIPLPEIGAASSSSQEQPSTAVVERNNTTKETEQLVHDLQGQGQYIGRSSSYFFQMKLRALVGRNPDGTIGKMYLFGPNPATIRPDLASLDDQIDAIDIPSISDSTSPNSMISTNAESTPIDHATILLLVRAFFERINCDFPVLHEATFLAMLDEWRKTPTAMDPTWLCSFLCVLILARRVCDAQLPEDQEERWWAKIQSLLSKVIFTSSLTSIQALMLAALHLHNVGSRDTCWTLTGAAVRIGFAIGLHRDSVDIKGTPLTREMRKNVWWTLYAFEQIQVSSHDRPSAIDNAKYLGGSPRQAILDMGSSNPPEYMTWSNRLLVLLGAACRALPDAAQGGYSGPLSPAAGLLRELSRWRTSLPQHLRMDVIEAVAPSFHRPLILLHVQYHYIVSLIARNALLSRFSSISKKDTKAADSLGSMSDVCGESARLACQYLLMLDSMGKYNAVTWWDTYYLYSCTLVLALSIMCEYSSNKRDAAGESQRLLNRCTDMAARHLTNPMVPGTMRRWLHVVVELNTMIVDFVQSQAEQNEASASSLEASAASLEASASSLEASVATVSTYAPDTMQLLGPPIPRTRESFPMPIQHDRRANLAPGGWVPYYVEQDLATPAPQFFGPGLRVAHDAWYDNPEARTPQAALPMWQAMHWEGISDMLLGPDPRNWNNQ